MKDRSKHFGLLGRNISYSFSKGYFEEKFEKEKLHGFTYENYDIQDIADFRAISQKNLRGLNVTIPYKETVIPFLDKLSRTASEIGAVNTIKFTKKGKLKGYNTDFYGFKNSLLPLLKPEHKRALILGTGGASKGVAYALLQLGIEYTFVSRTVESNNLNYNDLSKEIFSNYQIVINCTPIGTSPDIDLSPELPYEYFTSGHIAYDLIYNPSKTLFLQKAEQTGATVKNGLDMLVWQAEKAWEIWNK